MVLCAGFYSRRDSGSGCVHAGVVAAVGVAAGLLAGIRGAADGAGEACSSGRAGVRMRLAHTDDVLVLLVHDAVAGVRREFRFRGSAGEYILVGAAASAVGNAGDCPTFHAGVVRLVVAAIAHAGDRGLVVALFRVQPVAQ